jgi:hypothetical protein
MYLNFAHKITIMASFVIRGTTPYFVWKCETADNYTSVSKITSRILLTALCSHNPRSKTQTRCLCQQFSVVFCIMRRVWGSQFEMSDEPPTEQWNWWGDTFHFCIDYISVQWNWTLTIHSATISVHTTQHENCDIGKWRVIRSPIPLYSSVRSVYAWNISLKTWLKDEVPHTRIFKKTNY